MADWQIFKPDPIITRTVITASGMQASLTLAVLIHEQGSPRSSEQPASQRQKMRVNMVVTTAGLSQRCKPWRYVTAA